jgi:hypothetical protein
MVLFFMSNSRHINNNNDDFIRPKGLGPVIGPAGPAPGVERPNTMKLSL